jgi:hypothetical protein
VREREGMWKGDGAAGSGMYRKMVGTHARTHTHGRWLAHTHGKMVGCVREDGRVCLVHSFAVNQPYERMIAYDRWSL